ncbi:amino acid deaminase [Sandaracinobacter neustonicus]|uniref:Amino acid deaminase n=1 Tax=Sandaracinobacter neustonicus TaxID=1715348 RepID=A0A501XE27_9SPHN|nr:amino acid deaminase [Sandaracinobacter neustonicus]TPE58577.1 amino acid deaminase [Sandaracinobacter neustonicus]
MGNGLTSNSFDWRTKGIPAGGAPITAGELAARQWRVTREDLMLPVALLRKSALLHNSDWMRRFTALTGVRLAPHGKTTMSPELFAMQMADGAWGMTAATPGHVRIYREFGLQRILLANQLVGRQAIAYVAGELARDAGFDFYCLVDSVRGVEILEAGLSRTPAGRPLQVLIELGYAGGRSGLRDDAEALQLARRIAASPLLSLRGIEAFEGIVQSRDEAETLVGGLLHRIRALGEAVLAEGLFEGRPILSAGGSSFFDLVAGDLSAPAFDVVLRSGCYLVHDSHFYRDLVERLIRRSPAAASLGEGLRPALEIWAHVLSRPEPTRLLAGLGKRDTSDDVRPPTPLGWCRPELGETVQPLHGHKVVRLDDQHAYLDIPADSPLQAGDMISFGISHPCTTFDKWRTIFIVDDDLTVIDAITTCF